MALKKMTFLPKKGSNAKSMDDALVVESTEKDVASPTPIKPVPDESDPSLSKEAPVVEKASDEKQNDIPPSSPKRDFLPKKFNFSPGRKSEKETDDADLYNVACERGANSGGDVDDDMSVEVSMAAAEKGVDVDEEEDGANETPDSAPVDKPEAPAKMSALEKLKSGKDDDDIDLAELASEIKGKFKNMFRKDKSAKSAPMPQPEMDQETETAKPVDEKATSRENTELSNSADTEGASDSKAKKEGTASAAKKATFISKFFKSDDKSEATAPIVPEEEVTGERAVASKEGEKPEETADDKPINDDAPKSTALRSKFTKLFSKNEVASKQVVAPKEGSGESEEVVNVDGESKETTDDKPSTDDAPKSTALRSKFTKLFSKSEVASDEVVAPKEGSGESEEAVNVDGESKETTGDKPSTDDAPKSTALRSKFTKLFSKNEVASEEAVASKEVSDESEEAVKVDDEVKEIADDQNMQEAPKPTGMRSKFTKLFSKNDVSSAYATKNEDGAEEAEGSNGNEVAKSTDANNAATASKDVQSGNESDPNIAEDTEEKAEQKKGKGFKSKFMKKLGIAGAIGAVGIASVKANKDEVSDEASLGVIVHSDKPVSEAPINEADASANSPQAKEGKEPSSLDQVLGDAGATRRLSTDNDDVSDEDERAEVERSRCGLSDSLHDALMNAGEYMYETCGDPDFGTAKKMLGMMESAETAMCSCLGTSDEKKNDKEE
jgi:hypothetical protein